MSQAIAHITPELRQWITSQVQSGQPALGLIDLMCASGWAADVARVAVEQTLAAQGISWLPVAVPVPEPDLTESSTALTVDGHALSVLSQLRSPRVIVFGGLLSHAECDAIVASAAKRLARSETVHTASGGNEVNPSRTSQGMFFEREETDAIARVERRIAALLRWPLDHGEGMQVLHYGPGAEYKPHHDYFDPVAPGTPAILARGGQRVASLVIYLNTPVAGGATVFPDVGLEVAPVKGNGVFFSYDRPHPITRSLHGGAPVLKGEKWVATKWLRERVFT